MCANSRQPLRGWYAVKNRAVMCMHLNAGPKKAVQMHREYTSHITAGKDPQDFLDKVASKYSWPDGSPATDFPLRFAQNVRLFRYYHVFVFTKQITVADLFNGRCAHANMFAPHLDAFAPTHPHMQIRGGSGTIQTTRAPWTATSPHNGGAVSVRVSLPVRVWSVWLYQCRQR